ncbi:MAG: hypothetical protein JSS86_01615 [Cyanobacteria bacterium SZAS LIN-2]|nr:hypothetical protein [Cyanobacteria bacterium SZAS LIN-3]MBS1994971.1 hypothetical protein [Cyanobacteria bacterium SZAS LIN-2]
MTVDIVFEPAQFKKHLDDIYRDKIISDTYFQRPNSRTETLKLSAIAKSDEGAGGLLPSLTIAESQGLTPDFDMDRYYRGRQTRPGAESQTDIAKAQELRDLSAQKELLAHPGELRRLFPEMLKEFDLTHQGYLDRHDIAKGLARGSLTDLQRNYLTVLRNGYDGILRDSKKFAPGIQEYDLARIEKAMNRSLPEDPIWAEQARVTLPTASLISAVAVSAISVRLAMKNPVIYAGSILGVLAFGEACVLYNHLAGRYNKEYDNIEQRYRRFVDHY